MKEIVGYFPMDNATVADEKKQRLTRAYFMMNDEGRGVLDMLIKKMAESGLKIEVFNEKMPLTAKKNKIWR